MSRCRSHARSFLFALIGLGMSVSACGAPIDSMKALTVRTSCRRAATGEEHGAGSGLLVGTGAYVATNFHVVSCADRDLEIVVGLGTDEVRASVVVRKPEQDLAVLRLERSLPSSGATLSTVRENAAGQTVYAVGFPAAAEEFVSGITVTRGIISDIGVTREGRRLYQVDAAINPGSSGGPLFNEHGEVIGINTMKALRQVPVLVEKADGSSEMQIERVSIGEGIGFAIPVDELVPELERLGVRTDGRGAQLGFPAWLEPALLRAAVLAVVAILLVVAVVVGRRLLPCAPLFRSRSRTTPVRPKAGCRLVGRKGPFAGRVFELDRGPVVLGRDPVVCQIVFPSSAKSVSRRHCRVRWDEGASVVHLTDEGSTNGTFTAAGDRIEVGMTCKLRDGEQFHIGDGTAVFRVQLTDD